MQVQDNVRINGQPQQPIFEILSGMRGWQLHHGGDQGRTNDVGVYGSILSQPWADCFSDRLPKFSEAAVEIRTIPQVKAAMVLSYQLLHQAYRVGVGYQDHLTQQTALGLKGHQSPSQGLRSQYGRDLIGMQGRLDEHLWPGKLRAESPDVQRLGDAGVIGLELNTFLLHQGSPFRLNGWRPAGVANA